MLTFKITADEYGHALADVHAAFLKFNFLPGYGMTAGMDQPTAMCAMASVMGQVFRVFLEMRDEDNAFSFEDRQVVEMSKLGTGWRDRAAERWSAQVRAKVKARDEARRADVAVRCQGEED